MGRRKVLIVMAMLAACLSGCASDFYNIAPRTPQNFEKLGPAHGRACGYMMIWDAATNFIPINLSERTENAYKEALASVPGATALVNVTMQEEWYWWAFGTTRCVVIIGEAIR